MLPLNYMGEDTGKEKVSNEFFTKLTQDIKDQLERENIECFNLEFISGRLAYFLLTIYSINPQQSN